MGATNIGPAIVKVEKPTGLAKVTMSKDGPRVARAGTIDIPNTATGVELIYGISLVTTKYALVYSFENTSADTFPPFMIGRTKAKRTDGFIVEFDNPATTPNFKLNWTVTEHFDPSAP